MYTVTESADFYPSSLRKEWSDAARLASAEARKGQDRLKMGQALTFYGAQQNHKAMMPGSPTPAGLSAVRRDAGAKAREALETTETHPGTEHMRQALMFYSQGRPEDVQRDQGSMARAALGR